MKTGTKLHFININDPNDRYEEFFIGGALPYKQYTTSAGLVKYSIVYTVQSDLIIKTYALIDEDLELFTSKQTISVNGNSYRRILPVYDIYSLKQNLESRCTILKGELPYNTQHGIPLKSQLQDTQISIVNIINSTPGVQNCEVLASKLVDKKFKLEVKVKSNFGTFIATVG